MIISMNDYYYVWLLENCMCVRVPGIFQRILWDQHCEALGKPTCKKSEVFLNIVQKAFDPPPPFIWTFVLFCGGCFLNAFLKYEIYVAPHIQNVV